MKNNITSLLTAGCLAILAAGCASGPKYSEYRCTVPAPSQGSGRIWFYRPSAVGAAVQPAVKLDGQQVGNAVPHGFFHVVCHRCSGIRSVQQSGPQSGDGLMARTARGSTSMQQKPARARGPVSAAPASAISSRPPGFRARKADSANSIEIS